MNILGKLTPGVELSGELTGGDGEESPSWRPKSYS